MTTTTWRKCLHTNISELIFITSSTRTIALIKMINGGWKAYYGLENNCKSMDLWIWDKKKLLFETLVTPIILYGCEVWGCSISRESWRKIEKIQNNFITYNLKIKGNTPYPILLIV
jgi:hypothetical protein